MTGQSSFADDPQMSAAFVSQVLTEESCVQRLQPEWDALVVACEARACLHFAWALAGWRHNMAVRGAKLCVITVRQGGRLVGLWPLACLARRLHRELRPLGWDEWDSVDLMVMPGEKQADIAALLWRAAATQGDTVYVPYASGTTLLAQTLPAATLLATHDKFTSYVADFTGHADFDSYCATIGHSPRGLVKRERGLGRHGELVFQVESDPGEKLRVLRWALDQKKAWALQRGMTSTTLNLPHFEDFLQSLLACCNDQSPSRLFSLRLNGTPIAVNLAAVSQTVLTMNVVVFDPAWSKHSPGILLQGRSIEWAQAHHLVVDYSVMGMPYKEQWCNSRDRLTRYLAALTPRGCLPVAWHRQRLAYRRLRSRYRRALGWVVSRLIKPWAGKILIRIRSA